MRVAPPHLFGAPTSVLWLSFRPLLGPCLPPACPCYCWTHQLSPAPPRARGTWSQRRGRLCSFTQLRRAGIGFMWQVPGGLASARATAYTHQHTHPSCSCLNPQPAVAVASPISLKCGALGKLVKLCACVWACRDVRGWGSGSCHLFRDPLLLLHPLTAQAPRLMSL